MRPDDLDRRFAGARTSVPGQEAKTTDFTIVEIVRRRIERDVRNVCRR
jgi:hypothetical protein